MSFITDTERSMATERPDRCVVFAAGGTGGHIWPAVAVARALRARHPAWRFHFVSGDRPVEGEVYRAAEVEPSVFHVPAPGQGRWRTWLAMAPALLRAMRLLRRLRPDAVLSTGGYVAAPVAVAAWLRRCPTVLLEPNAVAGRVTRRLAPRVAAVALADPAAERGLRARRTAVTGNPLTWSPDDLDRAAARQRWGIPDDAVCVLVVGGSQGAKRLNGLMEEVVAAWRETPPSSPVHVIWLTGSANLAEIGAPSGGAVTLHLHGHLAPMTDALAAADLAVTRAGAGAVADVSAAGLPCVFLPLPIALDDHQRANARRLVEAGAAVIFDERREDGAALTALLGDLLGDRTRRAEMAAAARSLAAPEAAGRVADLLVDLAG